MTTLMSVCVHFHWELNYVAAELELLTASLLIFGNKFLSIERNSNASEIVE